jgi:hypothetical protein
MSSSKSTRAIPHRPDEFVSVLALDEPLFLVGGQAVNLWALYYQAQTIEFTPFVSRDMDVLGNRETARKIAEAAGVEPQYFPMRPPSNQVGVVMARSIDGQPLPIEILSSLHGIRNEDLHHPEYTMGIGASNVLVRVPGPIALLQAKIANSADLQQQGWQDERHVLILAKLMPAYLKDLLVSIHNGKIDERAMLKLLEYLLTVVTAPNAYSVLKRLHLDGPEFFSGIEVTSLSKLQSFLTLRLPRAFPMRHCSS